MKWLTLALQFISLRSSLIESRAIIDNAKLAAEKGKKAAVFSGLAFLAVVYFIIGSCVIVIELGSQWDKNGQLALSGTIFSGAFFVGAAFLLFLVGTWIMQKDASEKKKEPERVSDWSGSGPVKDALETFLVTLFQQATRKLKE